MLYWVAFEMSFRFVFYWVGVRNPPELRSIVAIWYFFNFIAISAGYKPSVFLVVGLRPFVSKIYNKSTSQS